MEQLKSLLMRPMTIISSILLVVLTIFTLMEATLTSRLDAISTGMVLIVMFVLTWFLVPPLSAEDDHSREVKAQSALGLMLLEVSAFYAGATSLKLLYAGLLPAALVITLMTVILVLRHRRGATPSSDSSVVATPDDNVVATPDDTAVPTSKRSG